MLLTVLHRLSQQTTTLCHPLGRSCYCSHGNILWCKTISARSILLTLCLFLLLSQDDNVTARDGCSGLMGDPSYPPPEAVVACRTGDVLIRHTILKSDHFPGCQNMRLLPLIDGAPNFRQVPELPVYGVAIPTVAGVRNVLDRLGAAKGGRKVLWINLREEPILFINGRPFVVREADKPFANLEYTGIDRKHVEDMEVRLRSDVLAEAAQYGGSVMVAHEDDQFQVLDDWEPVTPVDVQTPADVYAELASDGYEVEYLRVPITDEKAPKGDDFEALIERCWTPPAGAALVFNCQMGRGRTTTGMAIGCLLQLRRNRSALAPPPPVVSDDSSLPSWFVANTMETPLPPPTMERHRGDNGELKAGMFVVIRSLLRALERGRDAKVALDVVLDACSAMQNLREAIVSYRTRLFSEPNDMRRQSLLQVCLEYLERYYVLVVFAAYLDDFAFAPGTAAHVTFADWWAARPELQGILQRLLRSNPLAALALDKAPSSEKQALMDPARASLDLGDAHQEFLARRDGAVLGPHTILKQDHFPGCQSTSIPVLVPGAPNFRGVGGDDVRVFGSGIATVEGVRRVLEHVGAAPTSVTSSGNGGTQGFGRVAAVWHVMREEPVVFICGEPYVLREEFRPFKNLMEYSGIDADRLDQMESRLRDDVLAEAGRGRGRVAVTREVTADDTGWRSLKQDFESVPGPACVETPRQVFEKLQQEGYLVKLVRVPITDGTCPKAADFDAFYSAAAAAGPRDALIYTCQLGGGRTTTGMAIGTLLRMHLNGATFEAPSEIERQATLERLDEDVGGGSPRGGSDDEEDDRYRPQGPYGEAVVDSTSAVERIAGNSGASRNAAEDTPATVAAAIQTILSMPARKDSVNSNGTGPFRAMTPPMDAQARNLQSGDYVGVRKFTRTLERGPEAKAEVDSVVDVCGALINLRTAIMRYCKPKSVNKFYRPEIQARHIAFKRGSAYLERYCMLIAFAAYLHQCRQRGRQLTFEEWLSARPDIAAARDAIHQNPAGALAPVPAVVPLTSVAAVTPVGVEVHAPLPEHGERAVPLDEQRRVLFRRRGSTVGRRSILKSFTMATRRPSTPRASPDVQVPGIVDLLQASGLPVYTLGNASVEGVRSLLSALGARPSGAVHVIITDLREELVLYINGTPYLRRELEMPAAALHHAGIHAAKLEDLERRLRGDMLAEAAAWGGKVLLHREIPSRRSAEPHSVVSAVQQDAADVSRAGEAGSGDISVNGGAAGAPEDITKTTDNQPVTQLAAFWVSTGDIGDIDGVSSSCKTISAAHSNAQALNKKKFSISTIDLVPRSVCWIESTTHTHSK
jgi:protein-tyrosine phosphatase